MSERFSATKMFNIFDPTAYYKVIGLALRLGVIGLIIMGGLWIKNMLFPPAPANVNKPEITVESGGHVEYKVIQNEQKRRLEYFGGGFGSTDKEGEWRAGLFGGVKW